MRPRDLPQPTFDGVAPEVAPRDHLRRAQLLLRACAVRQFGAERRPELVRVEVEDGELAQIPRWHHTPIGATSGDGELPQGAEPVRLRRDVAEPVRNARRVVLARVVPEAGLEQHVVRPGRAAVDRERRRPVRERRPACRVANDLDRTLQVGAELDRRLVVHARVRIAVARGVVAATDDLGDELAVLSDRHAEQEERRLGAELVEEVEQVRRLALERRVRPVPVGQAEAPMDELVPVFEVDREQQHAPNLKAGVRPLRGQTPSRPEAKHCLAGGGLMRRVHAQPARAARKRTAAQHDWSAWASPARVPREAASPNPV